jgi:hypothetical protein
MILTKMFVGCKLLSNYYVLVYATNKHIKLVYLLMYNVDYITFDKFIVTKTIPTTDSINILKLKPYKYTG